MYKILILQCYYVICKNISDNYYLTSGILWNYYIDEVKDNTNEKNNDDYKKNNEKTPTSKSFEDNTSIVRSVRKIHISKLKR